MNLFWKKFDKQSIKTQELVSDKIIKILDLISDKSCWCQRALARDSEGKNVGNPWEIQARSWCLSGACFLVCDSVDFEDYNNLQNYLDSSARELNFSDMTRLNDLSTHENVIDFLKKCLKNLGYKVVKK